MNDPRIILVCGRPRSGKSTVGRLLAAHLGLGFANTSDRIKPALSEFWGGSRLGEDKERVRPHLIAMGDAICCAFPGALVWGCYSAGARVIAGVRRVAEVCAAPGKPVVVWVARWPDPGVVDNTECEGLAEMADYRVENDGDLRVLADRARDLACLLREVVLEEHAA